MNFDFLNNITINKVEEAPKKTSTGRVATPKNPESGLTMRLFKDGAIYPSQELVDTFNLEYNSNKTGNGFDVFSANNWNQYPEGADNVVFISATPKSNSRVDLFSQARVVDGELTKVMEQGSKTFGLELIPMLESTYGTKLFEDKRYVDLVVVNTTSIQQDVVYVPKMVMKGEHKGTISTERRENVTLYPLAIMTNEVEQPEMAEVEEELV
jgi:hypothetical protein